MGIIEFDAFLEFGHLDGGGAVNDVGLGIEIAEDGSRGAESLLKDVVDVGEALDGLIQA